MKRLAKRGRGDAVRGALVLLALLASAAATGTGAGWQLDGIRRIHVEKLTGGDTAEQIRTMIIAEIQSTGLFVLTESPENADAYLRGSAEDLVFNETHDSREGINARGTLSVGSSRQSSSKNRIYTNSSVGESSSSRTVERKHEAVAAVRLVGKDGDILWSTVQESKGSKFRGASADVAEKVAKQLMRDLKKGGQTPAP